MKRKILNLMCMVLTLAIVIIAAWGMNQKKTMDRARFQDEIEQVDLNTIRFEGGKKEIRFSEVILSDQEESRKLIVSTQTATVDTEHLQRSISFIDIGAMTKTQKVTYTGTGYFVVDLDELTENDLIQDPKAKTLTIRVGHAHLQTIDIDPNNIRIDDVKQGLFTWGEIALSAQEYNDLEKDLRSRLENALNTVENGQTADVNAKAAVKKVYEPIVKAIDGQYEVIVEFR